MIWSYSHKPEIWPAIVTLALMVFLGQYSWRRRHIPGARLFTVACILCAPWIVGVIMEISAVAIPAPSVDSANIDPASSAAALSKRQLQVLRLVAEGLTYREVGARL